MYFVLANLSISRYAHGLKHKKSAYISVYWLFESSPNTGLRENVTTSGRYCDLSLKCIHMHWICYLLFCYQLSGNNSCKFEHLASDVSNLLQKDLVTRLIIIYEYSFLQPRQTVCLQGIEKMNATLLQNQ